MNRPEPPPSLVKHLQERRCILFAGAGLSAQAGLPTWGQLIKGFVEEVRREAPLAEEAVAELDRLVGDRKFLEVADHCKDRLKRRYVEILAERLRAGSSGIPEAHRLVMKMPFGAWVTTNFDKLLERAYVGERGDWPKVYTHADTKNFGTLLLDDAPFILKAHGDIDKLDSLVLTARDYSSLIHANPAFNAFFSALLLTRAVLFVGYSLSDPDFRLLLDRQLATFEGEVPDRYALMEGVGEIEGQVLDRTAGIRVLSYPPGDHDAVLEFLRALHDQASPQPETRAAAVAFSAPVAPVPAPGAAPPVAAAAAWQLSLKIGSRLGIEASFAQGGGPELVREEGAPIDWAALLRSLSTIGSDLGRQAGDQDCEAIGRLLGGCLAPGVAEALGQEIRPTAGGSPSLIVLRLTPEIAALPWELTRVGEGPLALRSLLVRAPVGISDAARGLRRVRSPARLLLVGDPCGDLGGAREEVRQIAGFYREARQVDCTCLVHQAATVDAVLRALDSGSFDIVHFAGHAWYDPHEVYLALSDRHLTSCMLRPALNRHPPAIMVFNSHFTSFVPPGVGVEAHPAAAGGEPSIKPSVDGRVGFAELAMRTGVGAFVGCFGSPSDSGGGQLGVDLHEGLLRGESIARALYYARRRLAMEDPRDPTPQLYTLNGYPDLTL